MRGGKKGGGKEGREGEKIARIIGASEQCFGRIVANK